MDKALPGVLNNVSVDGSKLLSLSYYKEGTNSELNVNNLTSLFKFLIPREKNQILPVFVKLDIEKNKPINNSNSTNDNTNIKNSLLLNGFILTRTNMSIHYHINPSNKSLGYFSALKFGGNPYLNNSNRIFDLSRIFCPQGNLFFNKIN